MSQDYLYNIAADFPGAGLYEDNLTVEIQVSSIVTALVGMWRNGDVLTIRFAGALSAPEKTTLDGDTAAPCGGLIAAHNATPPTEVDRATQIASANVNSDKNNYGGKNTAKAVMVRLNPSGNYNITGFDEGTPGRLVQVHNVGAFSLTFKDESAASAAANRLALAMDLVLGPDEGAWFQYDGIAARWRCFQVQRRHAVLTPNVIDDSLAQPPAIAGTVSVTNGSATVTGTGTAFLTALAVGMYVRFGSQNGTGYIVSVIASNTSLTLTASYTGTTNGSTTVQAPLESDAYIVGTSPVGWWSAFAKGDLIVYNGSTPPSGLTAGAWTKLASGSGGNPAAGTAVIVTGLGQGTAAGAFAGKANNIAVYSGSGWTFTLPSAGLSCFITGAGDPLEVGVIICKASGSWVAQAMARYVTAVGTITTISTTDVVATGMSVVPAKGTYEVEFQGSGGNSGTATNTMSIYTGSGGPANGTQAPESPRAIVASAASRIGFPCAALVTVDGTRAITGQWKVSATTGTTLQRTLRIRRVA